MLVLVCQLPCLSFSPSHLNLQTACEDELGSCVRCSNDGTSVRWHQGTEISTKPETQKCEKTTCKPNDIQIPTEELLIRMQCEPIPLIVVDN